MASFKDFAQAIKTVRFTGDGAGAEFASEQLAIFARQQLGIVIADGSGKIALHDGQVHQDHGRIECGEVDHAAKVTRGPPLASRAAHGRSRFTTA